MATIALGRLSYVGNVNGVGTQILSNIKEANSQTFKRGEPVTFDGSGAIKAVDAAALVNAGTDDSLDISDHTSISAATVEEKIVGIALRDASNVTSGNLEIPVQMLRGGDILEGNLVTGILGSGLGSVALALAHVGDAVSLVKSSTTGLWHFTTTAAEEVGRIFRANLDGGRGVFGDTNARVHVIIRNDILFLT